MLPKHPPVDPVLSILSCSRKPSVGVSQVVSSSPDPGIAWPSTRFRPDLSRWFEEDTASIRRVIHSGYTAKQREATGLGDRGKCSEYFIYFCFVIYLCTRIDHQYLTNIIGTCEATFSVGTSGLTIATSMAY